MSFRRLLRGEIDGETLDRIGAEIGARYGIPGATIEPLESNNWLSTPGVVGEELFVKVVTPQNALVHAVLTAGRNIGAFSSGAEGFFGRYDTPVEMAEHELDATERMRALGVNAPEPRDAFEFEGCGILVLEYIPAFRSLDDLPSATVAGLAPDLFETLATMHDAGIVHGDLRGENVLVADGSLYVIDATKVRPNAIDDALAYDVACALGTIERYVDAATAVAATANRIDDATLLAAESFLDFVNMRPDHDFDAVALKAEIEKWVR